MDADRRSSQRPVVLSATPGLSRKTTQTVNHDPTLPQPALHLPDVTAVAVDTRSPALALRALTTSARQVQFDRCVLLTEGSPFLPGTTQSVECVDIGPIRSGADYSRFVLGSLLDHVHTSHVLIVQWDGFVVDAQGWQADFLDMDYLGAPWGKAHNGHFVGNGGFSLRSRKLLQALQTDSFRQRWHHPEDICIAQTLRPELERDHGIRFGSLGQAQAFAFENEPSPGPSFGFHGVFNLHKVLPPTQLAEVLAMLPDSVIISRDGFKAARALLRDGHRQMAAALLQRRLALGSRDWRSRWLALRAGRPDVRA